MALDINDLTYQQLYNTTLARIKAICYNIDSNRLPAELQSGYDEILEKVGDTEHHAKLQYTVKNAVSVVTTATVTQQLQAWLTARGIWANRAQKATPRGVLNYFNCISVFCRAHILVASSELVDTGYPVYVTSGSPEAIDTYKRSLELTENKTMVYVFIANAYMLNSNMKDAINYYRLAMKSTKDNAEITLIYIDILNEFIEGKLKHAA